MKIIKLTQNKEVIVDDLDFDWLSKYHWRYNYGSDGGEYAVTAIKQKTVRMHRLIMNAQTGQEMDHMNGNGLDNRRENLRFCTRGQNMMNRRKQKNTLSIYKGVRPRNKTWQAAIYFNNKRKHIGTYSTEEEAAVAYNKAALELFGTFANLNRIRG